MRGKANRNYERSTSSRDHPRLCGEKAGRAAAAKEGKGSPPPMRGKGIELEEKENERRDHPRLCGEK